MALGGSSHAAVQLKRNSVLSKHIRNGQVQSADVKDRSLLSRDFKAGQLPAGAPGPKGDAGGQGEPGSAIAYARVNADASLDTSRSKNVISSTRAVSPVTGDPVTGAYCLDLTVSPKNVSATPEWLTGQIQGRLADEPFFAQFCPGGADARILTTNSSGAQMDNAFRVTFN